MLFEIVICFLSVLRRFSSLSFFHPHSVVCYSHSAVIVVIFASRFSNKFTFRAPFTTFSKCKGKHKCKHTHEEKHTMSRMKRKENKLLKNQWNFSLSCDCIRCTLVCLSVGKVAEANISYPKYNAILPYINYTHNAKTFSYIKLSDFHEECEWVNERERECRVGCRYLDIFMWELRARLSRAVCICCWSVCLSFIFRVSEFHLSFRSIFSSSST